MGNLVRCHRYNTGYTMMRLRHGCCTDALNASEVVIPCKASREIFEVLKGIVRFRSAFRSVFLNVTRGSTSTAQHSSQRRVDARFADIPATALSGCTEGQLVEAALLGHIVKTVLNCPGGQLPNLMYSTSPEATAVRIQLWLEEKNIEGASTVTHCPMRHFSLGQTGYTCHPYQYNVKLPPASINRFLEAYETDPPLTDIATEKGVVQGRMQCTLLEEHPRNSSHTMRVQAHLQLLPGADCLGIWPPEHMQGAHTPQAIRQVMHILGCVLALSDLGAPPGSQEAWRAYAARVPLSSLRLMQALSVNAVTQERGQQAGAYTAHSTTPALREMLTACHSLVFELEGILTLRLKLCDVLWALHDAHHPPDAVAPLVSAQSAEGQRLRDMLAQGATLPLSFANFAGDMLTMKQHGSNKMLLTTIKDPLTDQASTSTYIATPCSNIQYPQEVATLKTAHTMDTSLRPTRTHQNHTYATPKTLFACAIQVIANEHPLGTVARAITASCMPNGLPLSSHGVREAPILYLTPASKQAMVSALAAAQDLGGVVETQRGQVWIGVPRSLAGVSGGINLPIWLKEVGTPVDAADPATRARTASRNTRYTGLQHVPDQAALTFRAIAAVTDGITMQQVVGANAAHELQGRATTYLVEARVVDHSDAKYTPAVLRALTHEGSTQPTPQPVATSRGWGTRAVAVATQLQAAPPRNTTATTAPIPPTGGSAARAPGRGGAGGRGRGPNSVPDPSGRGTSRGPSPNLVRGASPGAWAGIGTSSRASSDSSIAAFDELAIEAGFLYTAQAPTNVTGGNDGATLENNATLVDPLPHTAGDNDPSGGADTTQEGATQRDLAGSSGIQRAGGRTQVHSPALTPGAERAARRQRHGSSGGGRGLNLSYTSKMDSVSAEDHNPGGSPMEEEQEEMPKEGTKTAVSRPATQAHRVTHCTTPNHTDRNGNRKGMGEAEDLHNFWTAWDTTLHDEGDKKAWRTAHGQGGAFSDEVIHLYLRTKYGLTITRVAHLRNTDDWNDDNLDTIAIEYATLNFLCKTNGHSMALRKLGGQWKLLDSDSPSKSAIAICELSRSYTTRFNEVFVIAPDPAATPAQTMAATRQGISHIISHKEDNQNPSQCYMERQYKQCCLVHAINMAIGKPMIWPEDVITHCKSLDTHIQGLANQARQEHMIIPLRSSLPHIYEESGNFTISTINHYLYHHHKDLHLYPITTTTTTTNITPELLTTLTGKTDSYTNTAAILITHNHATTIRHINNAWHWLDSEQGRPCRLDTPEDWLQLKGTLVQIKKGDAADTNLIHPLCWLADPTRRATTEQLEQHLRTTHIDLTTQDLGTQPAHNPRTDRPLPTAQPASSKRILTATTDTHPTDKQARPRLRQVAPTVTLPTLQDRASSSKRPTTSGTIVDKRRTKPRAQTKDPHTQTLMYRYLNTAPTPPPAAIPTTPPPPTDNLPEHPGPHPQHSTLPTRQPQPTHNRQHITLTTLNVRSLHRSRNDVLNLVHQHSPDILILTETMTQPKSNNPSSGWLRRVMPDYTTHRHRGHSDVLIGIKHHLAIQMKTTMLPPSIDAEVNARCVILTLNQHQCEQLTIIATYWPSGNNGDALLLRGKMQEHIRTATGHLPGSLILAGDINATMKTEDRSEHTEYTQDSMMRGFAAEMHLKEADPGDRAWTYQQPHCNSRIDAILTRDARHGPEHRTYVDTNVYLSDHRPLTATLNTARLGIDLAAPHKPPKHSHTILTTPITNKDREAYRLAVQQPSSGVPQLHAELTAYLAPIYTEATHHLATLGKTNPQQPQRLTSVAGRPAREAVDTAATMLTNLLQTCRTAAIKTCNTKTLTRGGQHYQRRTMCRIRLALGRKLKTARDLSRKANSLLKQTNVHPTIDELTIGTDAINEEIRDAVQARQGEDPTENHVQAALAQLTNTYRDQIHQLDDDDSALAIAQARVRMQQLISTQPKKAYKRILRPSRTDHKGLQALADPDTKTICTAPADLNRIITAAYGQKLAAPTPKTGHYTNTQTRNYPWARAKADDAFALHACQNIHWLYTAIMDKAGFQECISRLSGGKAPGPDGVENEIIKMLPWEMRETIHQLFIIMWATGCTPTAWKTSDTCLLYKDKGQETDLNSYRPVGLANTVYKLWTSLITKTLSEYAEANGMLSKNQAGFRSHRNTTQQLQMLVMALEDAKLAKADIYALLVDFTSAFNTTCQDKLLWIMHDLGFPTDATDAVKDLYTGATTRFKTPYGHTDPVSVNRGTIQGDSLSPFLFLIYIEPLLRWLQVGARGYKFKSATADSGERATVSSIDYADDIAILCNTLRNLRCQADKLSAFSDWGHLIISHSKTLATAALHHSVETGMCSNAAEADKRARQQLRTVSLQGKPVTYHRPTSPFTYLGVLITMTLDWKPQHTAMITQLRQKLERLRRSFASARQAIHIIRTAIIPSLAYSFCAVPCTPGDLELYDRLAHKDTACSPSFITPLEHGS
ncbi:hypothetical protein QJQ45_000044 [Haematococcus lacustris]|nr:hypothetical protein QJQ45_000044 [Haematococcus lacustris]